MFDQFEVAFVSVDNCRSFTWVIRAKKALCILLLLVTSPSNPSQKPQHQQSVRVSFLFRAACVRGAQRRKWSLLFCDTIWNLLIGVHLKPHIINVLVCRNCESSKDGLGLTEYDVGAFDA